MNSKPFDPDVESAIVAAAESLGAVYPAEVPKLIDRSTIAVSKSGQVLGVAEAVEDFRRRYPKFFRTSAPAPAAKDRPKSMVDRARAVVDKHYFMFDPTI